MADDVDNFPRLPARQWWAIRDRLKRSVPSAITPAYVESTLAVGQANAREIVTQLQYLGLIGEDGRPTDVAEDWRHDETYSKACKAMWQSVYPDELREAAGEDRAAAQRWFARRKKVGDNAALKMAITYGLVASADVADAPDQTKAAPAGKPERAARAAAPKPAADRKANAKASAGEAGQQNARNSPGGSPSLHIDVQIHIAADATTAQIDQIFASMAKHLYRSGAEVE
jgi:uncharacterized protein DUF5343